MERLSFTARFSFVRPKADGRLLKELIQILQPPRLIKKCTRCLKCKRRGMALLFLRTRRLSFPQTTRSPSVIARLSITTASRPTILVLFLQEKQFTSSLSSHLSIIFTWTL
eukprot:XP_001704322.1 Hypothetical protein GL50803_19704 [Giardia lamblia ATCC 50803]